MKKLKSQLKAIANSLATLSTQVEKVVKQIDKLQAPKKAVAKKKKAPIKRPVVKKTAPKKQITVIDTVFNAIKRTKKGVTVTKLKEKTDLNPKQLSNALYKLTKQGKIEAKSRGLYVKK
jgi:predicted Rossmann fold nucleotide-binding protein DprA/Smf involved in DNA uptake